jgi:Membrane protein putatively involved in post-translational modification of the autoinducing quorum-sensing peptide
MLERLANKLADFLISKGADAENKDIYAYALEYIFSNVLCYGILLILAAVLNLIPQMLLLFLFWIPIRSYWGGIHAPSQGLCLFLSAIFGIGSVLLAVYFIPGIIFILACLGACIVLTYLFAPVVHPNHPVSQQRLIYVKKIVRLILIIECAAVIVLYSANLAWIASIGLYSISFAVLFGLLGKIVNKRLSAQDINGERKADSDAL